MTPGSPAWGRAPWLWQEEVRPIAVALSEEMSAAPPALVSFTDATTQEEHEEIEMDWGDGRVERRRIRRRTIR